jgi:hypothetical protein
MGDDSRQLAESALRNAGRRTKNVQQQQENSPVERQVWQFQTQSQPTTKRELVIH